MAPEYQTEKLVQCPKCGYAIVKYDRCTQTMGDSSYLSNSRSAPHLNSMDDDHEPGEENLRSKRRTGSSGGGDLLIDLSDDDRISTPGSPSYTTLEGTTKPMATLTQQQNKVRFNVSPNIHRNRNLDQQNDSTTTTQQKSRFEQKRQQEFMSIPISNDRIEDI